MVGSDLSARLIETAKDITAKSGLKNIEYYQADGQGSDAHDGQYDLVLAHTVISHVADPLLSCARPFVLPDQAARSSFTTATMHQ